MAHENISCLILSQALPVSAISLGRLVRDPLFPDVDFCEPALRHCPGSNTSVPAGADTQASAGHQQQQQQQQQQPAFAANVMEHRFENFQDKLDAARGTRLELGLLNALSLSLTPASSYRSSSTTLRSRLCVVRQLRNPDAYFRAACREEGVRAWLEEESLSPRHYQRGGGSRGGVYLVCGFKTLTDASVSCSHRRDAGLDVSVDVPVAAIAAAAAGGVPLPIPGSIGAAARFGASSGEELAYTAPGERVFAVQYRRIRFAWFSTRSAGSAYLDKGIRWKSFIASRSGGGDDGDEAGDGIEVEIAGPLERDELDEDDVESVRIDGENILYVPQIGGEEAARPLTNFSLSNRA